jgi:hypothetical protein
MHAPSSARVSRLIAWKGSSGFSAMLTKTLTNPAESEGSFLVSRLEMLDRVADSCESGSIITVRINCIACSTSGNCLLALPKVLFTQLIKYGCAISYYFELTESTTILCPYRRLSASLSGRAVNIGRADSRQP